MVIKERDVAGEPISPDGGVENLDDELVEPVSVSVEEIDPAENLARAPSKALKQKRKSEPKPKPKVAFKEPVHYGLDDLEEGPTREQLIDLEAIEAEERMQLIKDIVIVTVACGLLAVSAYAVFCQVSGRKTCLLPTKAPATNSCPSPKASTP